MGRYSEMLLSYDDAGLPALPFLLSIRLLYAAPSFFISLRTSIFGPL
jgi:hypothetical protein